MFHDTSIQIILIAVKKCDEVPYVIKGSQLPNSLYETFETREFCSRNFAFELIL